MHLAPGIEKSPWHGGLIAWYDRAIVLVCVCATDTFWSYNTDVRKVVRRAQGKTRTYLSSCVLSVYIYSTLWNLWHFFDNHCVIVIGITVVSEFPSPVDALFLFFFPSPNNYFLSFIYFWLCCCYCIRVSCSRTEDEHAILCCCDFDCLCMPNKWWCIYVYLYTVWLKLSTGKGQNETEGNWLSSNATLQCNNYVHKKNKTF